MSKLSEKRKAAVEATMKQAIYEATVEILLSQGLEGLTMDRVAEQAGMAKGTVYNYFQDKKSLQVYAFGKMCQPFSKALIAISQSDAPAPEKLVSIAEKIFYDFEKNRNILIILAQGRLHNLHDYHELLEQCPDFADSDVVAWPIEKIIANVFQQGVDTHQFRAMDSKLVADMFLGATTAIIDAQVEENRFRPIEENVKQVTTIFLNGLLNGSTDSEV